MQREPWRDNRGDETRLVETRPVLPIPRPAATAAPGAVLVRFGPGVPARDQSRTTDDEVTPPPSTGRRWRVFNLVLTATLALIVLWLLWPSPPVEVRQVTVRAPAVVSCNSSTDIVATLQTNGRPGDVRYRWVRNDGLTSEVLTASAPDGRSTVDVHLRWTFTGPGAYEAEATIAVIEPQASQATTSFTYRC